MTATRNVRPVRTAKEKLDREKKALELKRVSKLIKSLRGCCKGRDSLVDALYEGRQEKSFAEQRLEKQEELRRNPRADSREC